MAALLPFEPALLLPKVYRGKQLESEARANGHNPGILIWDAGIPIGNLTARPNTDFYSYFYMNVCMYIHIYPEELNK